MNQGNTEPSFRQICRLIICPRSTGEAGLQGNRPDNDGSDDASEYNPHRHGSKKGASSKTRGSVKRRGPYMTQRRREKMQAREKAQGTVEPLGVSTRRSANAAAQRKLPSANGNASLADRSREAIELEIDKETTEPSLEAAAERSSKRQMDHSEPESAKRVRQDPSLHQV